MSNESENKRIDLTEFEGMTEGPWLHTIPEHGWDDIVGPNGMLVAQVTLENHVDGPSIARLPDLIDELKRCYEELDAVKHEVENCSECGGHREEEGTFHCCQNYCRCEEFDASE